MLVKKVTIKNANGSERFDSPSEVSVIYFLGFKIFRYESHLTMNIYEKVKQLLP
jgi:hypothetical protein